MNEGYTENGLQKFVRGLLELKTPWFFDASWPMLLFHSNAYSIIDMTK